MDELSISNNNSNKFQLFEDAGQINNYDDKMMRQDSIGENKYDENLLDWFSLYIKKNKSFNIGIIDKSLSYIDYIIN